MHKNRQRGTYLTLAAALLLLCLPAHARLTVAQKKQIAHKQFQTAEKMREALNGRPQTERNRSAYSKVIGAYRKVYRLAPSGHDAAPSLLAMGELLAESGRALKDSSQTQAAIEQFKSIPNEYPGSRERVNALFTIGKIYQDDLNDLLQAKATFEEFLKKYPGNQLADDAKQALDDIADAQNPNPKKKKKVEVAQLPPKKEKRERTESKKSDDEPTADVSVNAVPLTPVATPPSPVKGPLPLVTGVRHWSTPDYTRVAIDVDTEVKYEAGRIPAPDRIFFDLYNTKLAPELMGKSFDVNDGFLRKVRVAQYQRGLTRVVLEVDDVADYSAFLLPNPYRLIIDIHGKRPASQVAANTAQPTAKAAENVSSPAPTKAEVAKANAPELKATEKPTSEPTFQTVAPRAEETKASGKVVVDDNREAKADSKSTDAKASDPKPTEPKVEAKSDEERAPVYADKRRKKDQLAVTTREAKPTSLGERSLVRALGLKIGRIVVDAGHGGHDTGTIGPNGLKEKDLVLDVSLRLGKLLENKLGADVVYTRDDDTFVPLETRTAVANQNQADLFISVHANSSDDPSARGVETYYLNFTSSADALEVAARENAVSEKSIHELQDLVKKIALKDKIDESKEFATNVQSALYSGLARGGGPRNRGVKKAPFVVLIGANMPSILAEISFVSNPNDERKLQKPDYRQRISESLYRGIAKYVGGLSGVKLASKTTQGGGE